MSELDTALVRRAEADQLTHRDVAIFALQDRIARQASQLGRSIYVSVHDVSQAEFDAVDVLEEVVPQSDARYKTEVLLDSNYVDERYHGSVTVSWFLSFKAESEA